MGRKSKKNKSQKSNRYVTSVDPPIVDIETLGALSEYESDSAVFAAFEDALKEFEDDRVQSSADVFDTITDELGKAAQAAALNDDRIASADNGKIEPSRSMFDLANNACCNLTSGTVSPMISFAHYNDGSPNGKTFARREDVFYYADAGQRLFSAAVALSGSEFPDAVTAGVQKTASALAVTGKAICLMPDTLGEFGDGVKSQVKRLGANYIAVPRSVVAAYNYAAKHGESDLWCYDFDLPSPAVVHIRIDKDENGEYLFTRMERHKIENGEKYSFASVARRYLIEFAAAGGFSLSSAVIDNLIDTRDILTPILNVGSILAETTDGEYKTITHSDDILNEILYGVYEYCIAEEDRVLESGNNSGCCFMLNVGREGFTSLQSIIDGARTVLKRIDERKAVWNEYLPQLSLEVIGNGRFKKLELIKKGKRNSIAITESDDGVPIPLDDGKFTLPAGVKEVLLPLEREEFGSDKNVRDKLAKFGGKCLPLSEPKEVVLSLRYSYGDPDSYKLTARGVDDPSVSLESEWCDDDSPLEVVWPEYSQAQIDISGFSASIWRRNISDFGERIQSILNRRIFLTESREKNNSRESNLFHKRFNECSGRPTWYFPRVLLKKISESYNCKENNDCRYVLSELFNSDAFNELVTYITDPDNSKLYQFVEHNRSMLINNVNLSICRFLSTIGAFYRTDIFPDMAFYANGLLEFFMRERSPEYLIEATRCISDNALVMDALIKKIITVDYRVVRNISVVCWYNKEWIVDFYNADKRVNNGHSKVVKRLEKYIINYLCDKCKNKASLDMGDNPRIVRDVIETAVALCRLREYDETIFDLNSREIKELTVYVKKLDDIVAVNSDWYKDKFVSRVKIEPGQKERDGLQNVSDPCYLLISQLSGLKNLKLIGFEE